MVDHGYYTRIYIVPERVLDMAFFSVNDEESIDKCSGEAQYSSSEEEWKNINESSPYIVTIATYPNGCDDEQYREYWR